jgi:hypothetical protein
MQTGFALKTIDCQCFPIGWHLKTSKRILKQQAYSSDTLAACAVKTRRFSRGIFRRDFYQRISNEMI